MNLDMALMMIAQRFAFDYDALKGFAAEDTIGGYHSDKKQETWPMGSLWEVEGKILYTLTRAIQPRLVIEVGTHRGCSTTHFAAALKANGGGTVIGIDVWEGAGDLIPEQYRPFVELHFDDGVRFVMEHLGYDEAGIIYEDADHSTRTTREVWKAGAEKIKAGGFLASHDAMHFLVGKDIWRGVEESGVDNPYRFLVDPSDCGLALWRAPQAKRFPVWAVSEETEPDIKQPLEPKEAPKPRRRRRKNEKESTESTI